MVDVGDVAEILEGDQESAERICSAVRGIDLESNNGLTADRENNEENSSLEQTEDSEANEAEKESEGELESV